MKKYLCATALCSVLFLAPQANADTDMLSKGFYFSGSLGLTMPNDSHWDESGFGGKIGISNSPNFAAALGLRVMSHVRTELELSYRHANLNDLTVNGAGSASLGGHLTTWGLLMNGYYDFMPDSKLNPWLSAGLGMARHNGSIDSVAGFGFSSQNGSDDVFAYQLGAGLDYNISSSTALYAGYRYFATSKADFDGLKASYGANEFRVGVRQTFN